MSTSLNLSMLFLVVRQLLAMSWSACCRSLVNCDATVSLCGLFEVTELGGCVNRTQNTHVQQYWAHCTPCNFHDGGKKFLLAVIALSACLSQWRTFTSCVLLATSCGPLFCRLWCPSHTDLRRLVLTGLIFLADETSDGHLPAHSNCEYAPLYSSARQYVCVH